MTTGTLLALSPRPEPIDRPAPLLSVAAGPVRDTQAATMTIGELLDFYEEHHVRFLKSQAGTSRRMRRYIAQFAALPLSGLTRRMVMEWYHEIGSTRGQTAASQALQVLHSMYVKAQDWELYEGKNPAARIKKFPKTSRARFVQSHELPRLLAALAHDWDRQAELFFQLLLFTGARLNEARTMKWTDLELERGLWHKPTTKNGLPHTIPLVSVLVEQLRQWPHLTPWVFSSRPNGKNGGRPGPWSATAIQHAWQRIRAQATLGDVRIHDLRRTTASWLAGQGANLSIIQQTLNHSSLAVTSVYARLTVEPVRQALEEQAERMLHPRPVSAAEEARMDRRHVAAMRGSAVPPAQSEKYLAHEEWPG